MNLAETPIVIHLIFVEDLIHIFCLVVYSFDETTKRSAI